MAAPDPPKAGHILFLVPCPQDDKDVQSRPASFEFEIPLHDLQQLVLCPIRWLKLVAWGLLNCTGQILDANNVSLNEDLLLDQLPVPGTYTFLPDQVGNFSLLNFEHVRTRRSEDSSASGDSHDSSLPGQEAQLAARDGGMCVFTGGLPIAKAHFIPRRFGSHLDELRDLAHERGFAFDHHLDILNRISLAGDLHTSWVYREVFILATDPAFVRKQDIPPPIVPLPAVDRWPGSVEPTGETYILQRLDGVLDARSNLRKYVPFNTSARFASASPSHAPCPRAVNYVYAAAMVEMYLRPQLGVERLLSRRAIVVHSDGPSGSHTTDAHVELDAAPSVGRRGSTHRSPQQTRSRRKRDLTPVEKLYLLVDEPARRRAERLQQQEAETKAQWLQDWRTESAAIYPADT